MKPLKENKRERSKESKKENQQQQRRRVRAYGKAWKLGFTARQLEASAKRLGMSDGELDGWLEFMNQVDWKFANGNAVTPNNYLRSLRMWHKTEEKKWWRKPGYYNCQGENREEMERIKKQCAEEKLKKAMESESAWELCEERCAEFDAKRCPKCKHWSVPPQLRERPIPPEQCLHFKPKGE